MCFRTFALLSLIPLSAAASDAIVPLTVCEVLSDLPAHEGKEVAVLGRYSFRKDGDARKAPANLVFRGSGVIIFLTTEH